MRKKIDQIPAVHIANPKTLEFQVGTLQADYSCRTIAHILKFFGICTDRKEVMNIWSLKKLFNISFFCYHLNIACVAMIVFSMLSLSVKRSTNNSRSHVPIHTLRSEADLYCQPAGIRCCLTPVSEIRDLGSRIWGKSISWIRSKHPRSFFRELCINFLG